MHPAKIRSCGAQSLGGALAGAGALAVQQLPLAVDQAQIVLSAICARHTGNQVDRVGIAHVPVVPHVDMLPAVLVEHVLHEGGAAGRHCHRLTAFCRRVHALQNTGGLVLARPLLGEILHRSQLAASAHQVSVQGTSEGENLVALQHVDASVGDALAERIGVLSLHLRVHGPRQIADVVISALLLGHASVDAGFQKLGAEIELHQDREIASYLGAEIGLDLLTTLFDRRIHYIPSFGVKKV